MGESLGVPVSCQHWFVGDNEVFFQQALKIADTGLQDGDQVTVLHNGFASLKALPDAFILELTSIREKIRTNYSSAFIILYKIKANASEGWLHFEPWRKSDHDK